MGFADKPLGDLGELGLRSSNLEDIGERIEDIEESLPRCNYFDLTRHLGIIRETMTDAFRNLRTDIPSKENYRKAQDILDILEVTIAKEVEKGLRKNCECR